MLTPATLAAMQRPIAEAASLPGFTYVDPAFASLEATRVFTGHWLSIGFGYQVSAPGQIMPVRIAGQTLIIVRGADAAIRVFHNVCRHRGAELVSAAGGAPVSAITCPYHGWTFGLDGQCLAAPYWFRSERRTLRPDASGDFGLVEVRSRVWLDTVFVDLSGTAPPFEEFIGPLAERWLTATIAPLSHVTTWESEIPANWKLVIENFLDTYHSAYVHPQVGPISVQIDHVPLRLSADIIGQRSVGAAINKPRSGAIPVVPELDQALGMDDETYCLFPNTLVFAQRSFFSMRAILPRGVAASYELNAVYVAQDAATDAFTAQRAAMTTAVHLVNQQDVDILARLQATRSSLAADRAHFVPEWDFMSHQFQVRLAEAVQDRSTPGR